MLCSLYTKCIIAILLNNKLICSFGIFFQFLLFLLYSKVTCVSIIKEHNFFRIVIYPLLFCFPYILIQISNECIYNICAYDPCILIQIPNECMYIIYVHLINMQQYFLVRYKNTLQLLLCSSLIYCLTYIFAMYTKKKKNLTLSLSSTFIQ